MNAADERDFPVHGLARFAHPARIHGRSPRKIDFDNVCAQAFGNGNHAPAEKAVDRDNHGFAGFNQIAQTKFHARHARAGEREGKSVFGLEQMPQTVFDFAEQHEQFGVKIANRRARQSL